MTQNEISFAIEIHIKIDLIFSNKIPLSTEKVLSRKKWGFFLQTMGKLLTYMLYTHDVLCNLSR